MISGELQKVPISLKISEVSEISENKVLQKFPAIQYAHFCSDSHTHYTHTLHTHTHAHTCTCNSNRIISKFTVCTVVSILHAIVMDLWFIQLLKELKMHLSIMVFTSGDNE